MELNTPALLFPAVSLLFLSYNNRFLALASLVRGLHAEFKVTENKDIILQIENLRYRLKLAKWMEFFGALSFILAAMTMFCIYLGWQFAASIILAISILMLIGSLVLALMEIWASVGALSVLLGEVQTKIKR